VTPSHAPKAAAVPSTIPTRWGQPLIVPLTPSVPGILSASILCAVLAGAGCASAVKNKPPGDTGGESGEPTGGSGGSSTGGGSGTGGASATGGAGPTGGSGGNEGTGGAPPAVDAAAPDADMGGKQDGPSGDLGGTLATHPWVIPCQADWTRAQCCMHYCMCMTTNCPSTAPANCVATCSSPGNNWNLKCRVEQCFEALDPKYPMDKASHCGHAVEKPPKCQGIIP
jgi:hypothetical protein